MIVNDKSIFIQKDHFFSATYGELGYMAYLLGTGYAHCPGPSGNISLKSLKSNYLIVKASGKSLSNVYNENIFVKLELTKIVNNLNREFGECQIARKISLRPSMEVFAHAIIPCRMIIHTHSVFILRYLVSNNGIEKLSKRLNKEKFIILPYFSPGKDLALAMRKSLEERNNISFFEKNSIFFLQNHGIFLGGQNVQDVLKLFQRIQRKLITKEKFYIKNFFNNRKVYIKGIRKPFFPIINILANTKLVEIILRKKIVLYPDFQVFLADKILSEHEADLEKFAKGEYDFLKPACFIVYGEGVYLRETCKFSLENLLAHFAELIFSISEEQELLSLTDKQVNELNVRKDEVYRINSL